MVIPAKARKEAGGNQGDVLEVVAEGDGRIVLVRLERTKPAKPTKAKITYRKGTHAVGSTGRRISSADVHQLLNEV
jgi:bifunctional DNA-binding transcriptional regulator/antitoxin component of YhaV-PrlF toxin-antitoxin module